MEKSKDDEWIARSVRLACESAGAEGGPFGALVVRGDLLLGQGTNRVTLDRDPTAHAEVVAIRAACAKSGTHALKGAVLYTSCEPCPMCLAAAWWARVDRIVYCATRQHAAAAGFDDARVYKEITLPLDRRQLPLFRARAELAENPFRAWKDNPRRVPY